jgi:hypothetical protein
MGIQVSRKIGSLKIVKANQFGEVVIQIVADALAQELV